MLRWSNKKFKEALDRQGLSFEEFAEKLAKEKRWPAHPRFIFYQVRGLARDREPVMLKEYHDIAEALGVDWTDLMEKQCSSETD